MTELWSNLGQLVITLLNLVQNLGSLFMVCSLFLFLAAFSLWAIDWRRLGPVLREGAALPFALLVIAIGGVWGALSQSDLLVLGISIPNYTWQTMAAVIGAGLVLLCGWLQQRYGWFPQTIEIAPPASHHHDHHGQEHHSHDHADHAHHAH